MTNEIRLRHLSPIVTDALRRNLRIQMQQKTVVIGRTVARFIDQTGPQVDSLLDGVITQEIPYAGASSASVKRLRLVRQAVRAHLEGRDDETSIEVLSSATTPPTANRGRLLDLLAELYEGAQEKGWYEASELARLVSGDPFDQDVDKDRFRAWLTRQL